MKNRLIASVFMALILCGQNQTHAMGGLRTGANQATQYARQYVPRLTSQAMPTSRTFLTKTYTKPNLSQRLYNTQAQNRAWYQTPRISTTGKVALGLGGAGLIGTSYLNYLKQEPVLADEHKIFPEFTEHKEYAQHVFNALGFRYDETRSASDNFKELFATALFEKNKTFSEILPFIKELPEKLHGIGLDIIRKNGDLIASLAKQEIEEEKLKDNKNLSKIEMIKNEMADLFIRKIYSKRQLRELASPIRSAASYDRTYHYDKEKLEKSISDFKKYPGLLRAMLKAAEEDYIEFYHPNYIPMFDLGNGVLRKAKINNYLMRDLMQIFNGEHSLYNHDPLDKNLIELLNILKDEGLTEEGKRNREAELRNNSLWYLYGRSPW